MDRDRGVRRGREGDPCLSRHSGGSADDAPRHDQAERRERGSPADSEAVRMAALASRRRRQAAASQRARVGRSAKLGDECLKDRGAWVVDGAPAPFTEEELSEKGEAARALELEGSYLVSQNTGEEVGFFFDLQADLCATQEEVEEIQSLLLTPEAEK